MITAEQLKHPADKVRPLKEFVPFSPPLVGPEEMAEVVDTLKSGWLTTGPKTERFEKALGEYCGAAHVLAVNSCTAALHLALNGLGIGSGDGVITTPFTFASTGHVILYQRARPFLVDVEPATFNLDPDKVRLFLEKECRPGGKDGRPRHQETGLTVKAILPVHYGGHPCRMTELLALAQDFNLAVIEDAAHAIGAAYHGRRIGSWGDATCLSFYATKNLTTGEGGAILTDDEELARRLRVLSMYGISDARRIWTRYAPKGSWVYDVVDLGFKYNMMDIQAALGLHQLAKLETFIARRAENAAVYSRVLSDLDLVRRPTVQDYARHAWHLYPILLELERLNLNRDAFIERLKEHNIGTSVLFIPLHFHSFYRKVLPYREGDFPIAEDIFRRLVNLPISPAIRPETILQAAETTAGLLKEHRR